MSFRIPFPATSMDGRIHREEELSLARRASYRNAKATSVETPTSSAPKLSRHVEASPPTGSPALQRRHIALPDPVAFKFLEEDPLVSTVERRTVLQGYELYLVEQWACSRQSPTLVIVTYTGDPKHSVVVGVLGVPREEKDWSPRLRLYFKAIEQYHARPKETEAGEVMVTNLSSFPSALTVIPVPDGDIRKHRQMFIINEDLKRLGCSGRSGLTLSDPTPATQAKFLQLYKTSERIPFVQSVLELIKLCQAALFLFGKLERDYIDGLLCDLTEAAVNDWWTEIGSEYYNVEPTDGILGPTTVAALLGTLMGARNRLSYYGAPVSKDVFDLDSMKRGIGTFQKSYKLEKTRRLDRQTLLKLHRVTAKAASGEGGWGVQKAVKSTVAEIGGKRGEIVIDMVGGRDKAGIGDVETMSLDKFVSLAAGDRAKWLWHGKQKRALLDRHEDSIPEMSNLIFGRESKDDTATAAPGRRTQSLPLDEELEARKKEEPPGAYPSPAPASATTIADPLGERDVPRKTVFKTVAGRVSDARSGFGRIRDAVGAGFRGHASRPSRDFTNDPSTAGYTSPTISSLAQSSSALSNPAMVSRAFTWKNKPEEYVDAFKKEREAEAAALSKTTTGEGYLERSISTVHDESSRPYEDSLSKMESKPESQTTEFRKDVALGDISVGGSVVDESDLRGPLLTAEQNSTIALSCLQRRHSIDTSSSVLKHQPNEDRWPRRLSFSFAEEAVLRWEEVADITDQGDAIDTVTALQQLDSSAEIARSLYDRITELQMGITPWVSAKLGAVDMLDDTYAHQRDSLQNVYFQLSAAYHNLKQSSDELLAEERAHVTEGVKDVEVLIAKLEYEINALVSKVQDVEDGIAQFEAQVEDVERRAGQLKTTLETESWPHWLVRTMTGIGTGPNITRERRRP